MSSGNLTLSQLQSRLANATGKMHRVLTNQIRRLIESLQALIPAPPPTRAPITRKRLTLLEQLKLSELKYSIPQRGYKLYNPVKDTYISNTKLNRENVKKQIEAHKEEISIKRKAIYQQKKQAKLLLQAQTNIQEQTNIQV